MEIVVGLDLHRSQITFRTVDLRTGEVQRGKIYPGAREAVREWLERFEPDSDAHFALEGTTGWRFVVEEIERGGFTAHLADPAELRTLVRLRKTLVDQRIEWQQRLQAQVFHQGVVPGLHLLREEDRRRLLKMQMSAAGRQTMQTGLLMVDAFDSQLQPLGTQLVGLAKTQPGCRALEHNLFGVGWLTSVAILSELGDCRRFHSADQAVRASGLDITVYESNGKRPGGHLARQGPQVLRWA